MIGSQSKKAASGLVSSPGEAEKELMNLIGTDTSQEAMTHYYQMITGGHLTFSDISNTETMF
jgi:ferritin-like protein